jgi:hypothetical protein
LGLVRVFAVVRVLDLNAARVQEDRQVRGSDVQVHRGLPIEHDGRPLVRRYVLVRGIEPAAEVELVVHDRHVRRYREDAPPSRTIAAADVEAGNELIQLRGVVFERSDEAVVR